ncbi:MAG: phosphotransferase, partial [Cyanobacteria bacterium J06639_18]
MKASEFADVFERMGITLRDVLPETIYPFSPVFKAKFNSDYIIVKRTRSPLSEAENLLKWTANMAKSGVKVVLPVSEITPNPVLIDDYVWVAYPFISGRSYHGTPEDIIAAGRLLGHIHAAPIPNTFQLYQFSWPNYDDVSIQEDINGITNRIEKQ